MKALKIIFIALAILLPSSAFSEDLGTLRITLIEGDAHVYDGGGEEWLDASANMPLKEDDSLWVPEASRMEIHVLGGAVARLDGRTALDVLDVGEESVRFYLDEGRLYVNSSLEGHTRVTVETQSSSIDIPEGSIAMIYVSSSKTTRVSVLKGHADVESGLGKARVNAGSSLRAGEELLADVSPVGDPSEWEKWNRERDKDITGPFESARYLPDELDEYAYDFDGNGTWVYVKEYGYVWRPSISISIGWAPYRHGRWAWFGGDYVWISYERWGWVPYHYGRWAYITRIGWCWLPPRHREVYWGPGFVAWVYTPTYVAWVPLAPGEIYYGYRYYGPGSVNIVNINIHKTVINHYHKNVYVKNAVTVIHRDTFISGKKVDIKLKRNPFLSKKRSVGPPDIRPERHKKRLVAMRGHDEKRFRERLERRDSIKHTRSKVEGARTPLFRNSHRDKISTAKTERPRPEKLRKERRHYGTKEQSGPASYIGRKLERPSAKITRPKPERTQKEHKRTEIKESHKSRPDTVKRERASIRWEKFREGRPWKEQRRPEVRKTPRTRPDVPDSKKRSGKLDREVRRGTPEGKPKPEIRKPSASGPRSYEKRQPRAAKPVAPEVRAKRRAPQDDERAVKSYRGRSDHGRTVQKEKREGHKERTSPILKFQGRGRKWL